MEKTQKKYCNSATLMQETTSAYRAGLSKLEKSVKKTMRRMLKRWFEEHPDVIAISWCQYTPSWNDGDKCVFGVENLFLYEVEEESQRKFPVVDGKRIIFSADELCGRQNSLLSEIFYGSRLEKVLRTRNPEKLNKKKERLLSFVSVSADTCYGQLLYNFLGSNSSMLKLVFGENVYVCIDRKLEIYTQEYGER